MTQLHTRQDQLKRVLIFAAVTIILAALVSAGPVAPAAGAAGPGAAAAVPPATGTTAVITVATGSERPTQTEIGPLAGVTLQLYNGSTAPGIPLADAWATCVSDADGDCSFVVPDTQAGGANRDRRFWVEQTGAPAGWFTNSDLVTGPSGGLDPTAYQFRTGSQLRAGNTYRSSGPGATFMQSSGNTNRVASGGIWQTSRVNPVLPAQCGLDVALVLDVSGSVGADLPNLKNAAKTLTNSLVGTPSQLALFTFSSNAPANTTNNKNRPLTPVSTQAGADEVNGWINGLTSGGGTNWDRGFFQVAQDAAAFDVAVVITDGNPTYYGNQEGPGNYTRFHEVEDGVFSANAIKAENTRMIAVGVGSGVSGDPANLAAISGPNADDDYYQTTDYEQAGAALRELALGNCNGSVTVVKQVVPSTAPSGSTDGAAPAGGWTLDAAATDGVQVTPANGVTAEGTGALNFDLTFPGGTSATELTVSETQQPGFSLVPVDGQNAVCARLDTGAAVPVTNTGETGFTVTGRDDQPISCVVYNRAPSPSASVVVDKTWVINGETFANGQQPEYLVAGLLVDGTEQPWGEERTDFVAGDTVPITEQIDTTDGVSGLRQCTLNTARVTEANGQPVDAEVLDPAVYQPTLQAGLNTYTVTNDLTCFTKLTLNKLVLVGDADPTSWTLTALDALPPAEPDPPVEPGLPGAPAPPVEAVPGPSGPTGVTGEVTPDATYPLAESGGDPNYVQLTLPDVTLAPGSTGSWICIEVDRDGTTEVPGYLNGLSGSVTVPFGTWVSCFAVNATATLTMIKEVVNEHGGQAVPGDWDLTATPTDPNPAAAPTQTVTGSTAGETVEIRPGQAYDLSESAGPPGYALDSIECTVESQTRELTELTLQPAESAVCTFTNRDQPALLTLVKEVENGTTGGVAQSDDWTLLAAGPTPVEGASGDPSITDAQVQPGEYTLSEADGPGGYFAGAWECTGAEVDGAVVTVTVGADVTCTITNTAETPTLTLVKEVTNTSGGTAVPSDWILTATGDVTISGESGSADVSAAEVPAGTYELEESGGPTGYTASVWTCTGAAGFDPSSVQLQVGDNATCTITNTDQPAALTLQKVVDPAASGSGKVPADWTLTATPDGITGQDPVYGNGDPTATGGVNAVSVFAGAYDLSEVGPSGFDPGDWVCEGGVLTGATVVVPTGGIVVCTITNTAVSPSLTLVKTVDNGTTGGTAVATDWTLSADGPTPISGATGSDTVSAAPVEVGTYALGESGPPGYTASEWACEGGEQDGASITVTEGQSALCTITNTANQPTLTLVKTVDNGDTGGSAVPTDWTLSAAGPTTFSGPSGSGSVTAVPVQAGEYTLTENDGPAGYVASDWGCVGASPAGGVVPIAGAGLDVTCTVSNRAVPPTLTLVKVVDNGDTGASTPATAWTLSADGPTAISGSTGDAAVTDAVVRVGDYTLTEAGPPGYSAGAWTCDGGRPADGATVGLGLGENGTCTITNTAIPGSWLLSKSSDPSSGEVVTPGSTITYRLTAAHQSGVAVNGAVVTDDLTEVLKYATLVEPLADGLGVTGNELTWALPEIPNGGQVEVTYQVMVLPDLDGELIVNGAKPVTPGGQCDVCQVSHKVGTPPQPTTQVPPTQPTSPTQPPTPDPLPNTGVPVGEYVLWGFGLMAVGAALLVAFRRRASRH